MPSGLNALVTGGSRGIGAAAATKLAAAGYNVTVASRGVEALNKVKASLPVVKEGQQHHVWQLDVSDLAAVSGFKGSPLPAKSYDVVVVNAGVANLSPLAAQDDDVIQNIVTVNLLSPIALVKSLIKAYGEGPRATPAHIVFVSSVAAIRGFPNGAVYSSTKSALDGLTRSLAKELGPQNIRVNSVNPGFTRTELASGVDIDAVTQSSPIKGWVEPEAIGDAILFLATSNHITGTITVIDNGTSA